LPDAPRAVPDVPFSRLRFLGGTRFRAGSYPVCSRPQGGELLLFWSDLSGLRVLAGLRASVASFPLAWAFPTAESSARYDSPSAYGGHSRCQYCSACLGPWSPATRRFPHGSVSGLPLPCLTSCRPSAVAAHGAERLGPPTCFDASLPACHGRRTSPSSPWQRVRVVFGGVKTLGVRHKPCRSCPSTSGCAVTPTASRRRCRRFVHLVRRVSNHNSAMDARRATGGWLLLTRQGLSPCRE
jgi:hypothetical protein